MVLRPTRPEDLISQEESSSHDDRGLVGRDRRTDTSTEEQNAKSSNQDNNPTSAGASSSAMGYSDTVIYELRRPDAAHITSANNPETRYDDVPPPPYTRYATEGYTSRMTEVTEMSQAIQQPIPQEERTQNSRDSVSHYHDHDTSNQQSSLTNNLKRAALACLVPCDYCVTCVGTGAAVCLETRCCTRDLIRWGR